MQLNLSKILAIALKDLNGFYRRYRNKRMRQVVIYLKQTGSDLARQTSFILERTRHDFDVIRLWEQPDYLFLQYPGLIPFATLGQTNDPEATLR